MGETALTVPTGFSDISQLAEGLADRVQDGMLMLYGPTPVDDNAKVRFAVMLSDESAALEGIGRAVKSIDGGQERPDLARFDIVLDSLELEGASQVVFERILLMRDSVVEVSAGATDDVPFGDEVSVAVDADLDAAGIGSADSEELAAEEDVPISADSVGEADIAEDVVMFDDDLHTGDLALPQLGDVVGDGEGNVASPETDVAAVPPSLPSGPAPVSGLSREELRSVSAAPSDRLLARPSREITWVQDVDLNMDLREPSGMFLYEGSIPIPKVPPRPELDPSLRVRPAPRPGEEVPLSEVSSGLGAFAGDPPARDSPVGPPPLVSDVVSDGELVDLEGAIEIDAVEMDEP